MIIFMRSSLKKELVIGRIIYTYTSLGADYWTEWPTIGFGGEPPRHLFGRKHANPVVVGSWNGLFTMDVKWEPFR